MARDYRVRATPTTRYPVGKWFLFRAIRPLIGARFAFNLTHMIAHMRLSAALAPLLALIAQPATAADAGKCKVVPIAKFPVVMEGSRASVPVSFNGKQTRIWLDSGAFFNFMPKAKAVELGLSPPSRFQSASWSAGPGAVTRPS